MMRLALILLMWLTVAPACLAAESNTGDKPLMQDVWSEVLKKAAQGSGGFKHYGKPRIVAKGAKPEIILKEKSIYINGKPVAIGQTIEAWKKALPGKAICDTSSPRVRCVWDDLGIDIVTVSDKNLAVSQFQIYFNRKQREPWTYATTRPDGTPATPPKDDRPKHPYPGYFELDGFGIDAKTLFWEIRSAANPSRQLRCDLRSCSHPHGAFNDEAGLYLRLNRADEYGAVYELILSR